MLESHHEKKKILKITRVKHKHVGGLDTHLCLHNLKFSSELIAIEYKSEYFVNQKIKLASFQS